MRKSAVFCLAVALSGGPAYADITGFSSPTGGGSFSASSASGIHIPAAGPFDGHWTITLNDLNPVVTFTVDNSFNAGSGGGALSFSGATLSGSAMPATALQPSPLTCQGPLCHIGFQSTFVLASGTYDLRVMGSNPFNGSYTVNVSVVPEVAKRTELLAGLTMVMLWMRQRRNTRPPTR